MITTISHWVINNKGMKTATKHELSIAALTLFLMMVVSLIAYGLVEYMYWNKNVLIAYHISLKSHLIIFYCSYFLSFMLLLLFNKKRPAEFSLIQLPLSLGLYVLLYVTISWYYFFGALLQPLHRNIPIQLFTLVIVSYLMSKKVVSKRFS